MAGRKNHWLIVPGWQKKGIGSFIDDYVPAGHTFAAWHDPFVDYATKVLGVWDIVANVPSMPFIYPLAIMAETINTGVEVYNGLTGSGIEVPFSHKDGPVNPSGTSNVPGGGSSVPTVSNPKDATSKPKAMSSFGNVRDCSFSKC
jgi:hypothetical protein